MLEVRELRKRYGDVAALDGVDLDVAAGEILCLLGPNGAGKTTLVSIVAGLRHPDEGTVRVGEIDMRRRATNARRLVGLAPQETGTYPFETVHANLRFFGELYGLRRKALAERIEHVAASLALVPLLSRMVSHLSGGERRRLHTAIALLHEPSLLLLDEATVGADVHTRQLLLGLVRQRATDGAAVVYSTHYLSEVEQLDGSVFIIDRGREVTTGTVGALVGAHGATTVELRFTGPAPGLPPRFEATQSESSLRLQADDPAHTLAEVLAALGPAVEHLDGVDIQRPTLDSVFLALTGRRYEGGAARDDEDEDSDVGP